MDIPKSWNSCLTQPQQQAVFIDKSSHDVSLALGGSEIPKKKKTRRGSKWAKHREQTTQFYQNYRRRLKEAVWALKDEQILSMFTELFWVVFTKKLSRNYNFWLCPFHDEINPSFSVALWKGFCHCFGCWAHGAIEEVLVKQLSLHGFDWPWLEWKVVRILKYFWSEKKSTLSDFLKSIWMQDFPIPVPSVFPSGQPHHLRMMIKNVASLLTDIQFIQSHLHNRLSSDDISVLSKFSATLLDLQPRLSNISGSAYKEYGVKYSSLRYQLMEMKDILENVVKTSLGNDLADAKKEFELLFSPFRT